MSSMRDTLDVLDWVDAIMLMFKQPKFIGKKLVVVEGRSDIALLRKTFSEEGIYYDSPCEGKESVIRSVRKFREHGLSHAIGVCDADFDHILGNNYDHIYLTDYHDIEMMMITDDFISAFFHEHTDHRKYPSENAQLICERIKNSIFEVCYKIGVLKFINLERCLRLKFAGMTYSAFITIDGFDITFDLHKYIGHILARNNIEVQDYNFYADLYENYIREDRDKMHMCNGHDFTYILGMIYKEPHTLDKNISQEKIERVLRMSYQKDVFERTNLARSIITSLHSNAGADA
ncbi:DUF4435 domain-containing protein [Cedecea davisae]|uniref:DUF4435 domain-containing protein n=1 Tax=Cedecea davisae TaxID=158484 RepID=UPI00376ED92E